ncbi:hypothetical protein NQZ68_007696 [Dissostichus eleginoides]|nr:hypothetical protein NQZ68_007696 [Dissostichus eleginoides]
MPDHPVLQISPNPTDSGPREALFTLGPPATAASDPLPISPAQHSHALINETPLTLGSPRW